MAMSSWSHSRRRRIPPGRVSASSSLESFYEFGSRIGIWRLIRLFDTYQVKPTIFVCAQALERNLVVTAAFVERRYDMVDTAIDGSPISG
jgi:hypothetical protein